jgi:hypothetical protein
MVDTKFWDDSYIAELSPLEKLLFLYLLTNPLTNISGVYELPLKRVAFDTRIPQREVEGAFRKFEKDGKLLIFKGWVGVANFLKHQNLNPNMKKGAAVELKKAPREITDRLCIDFQSLGIPFESLSHLNLNSNINFNLNLNGPPVEELSTEQKEALRKRRDELNKKWRM